MTQTNEYNSELDLLALFADKAVSDKYASYIKEYTVLETTKKIIGDMEGYFVSYPQESKVDWSKFATWFCVLKNSRMKPEMIEMYKIIFSNLQAYKSAVTNDVLKHFIKLDYAARMRQLAQDVIDGKPTTRLEDVEQLIADFRANGGGSPTAATDGTLVLADLNSLLSTSGRVSGAEWRLEDLNVSVGPLRHGDFVVVAARPETGKTSFVCSEGSAIVAQLDKESNGIIFNNEEAGERVKLRLYQSTIGKSIADIEFDPAKAEAEYIALMGRADRIDIYHSHSISTKDVERQLRKKKYGFIAFNRLDKIKLPRRKGEKESNDVEQLNQVYQWARGIAIQYGIVFAVVQADASAEGKRYIWMDQIYGSKTGVQGEADVLLCIGKDHDVTNADKRFLNVCKNKLPGGTRTDPKLSHAQWEIGFDRSTGRYRSLVYK